MTLIIVPRIESVHQTRDETVPNCVPDPYTSTMPVASHQLRSFMLEDDPIDARGPRGRVTNAIAAAPFTIEYLHESPGRSRERSRASGEQFGLFVKPNARARQLFNLDREILIWVSTYKTFQARDVDAWSALAAEHGARLSRNVVVLVTAYSPSDRSPFESESDRNQTVVHVDLEEFCSLGLEAVLRRDMYARDLFNVMGATTRAADFFGRRALIDSLAAEIETGTNQIGLFGLRKVGKTSVLNRLADKLQNSGKVIVARLDLQWTTSINPTPEYTLWALGESLFASHRAVRAVRERRLFGRFDTFGEIPTAGEVWEHFAADVSHLLQSTQRRICILVDEVERLNEPGRGRSFVRFWRVLRGLDQQFPGRLRFVVGGTSPQCAELGMVEGEDNPLFRYLQVTYLGMLDPADARELLVSLGASMGIEFLDGAIEWVSSQCGGHPALLRALGSIVHAKNADRVDRITVNQSAVEQIAPDLAERVGPILDQMVAALEVQHPDSFAMLEMLAGGRLFEYREYRRHLTSDAARLNHYGLVAGSEGELVVIGQLHARLQDRQSAPTFAPSSEHLLRVGEAIGAWIVEAHIASGGFADVYRLRSENGRAAAKVLRQGNIEALTREIEVLQQFDVSGVVRYLDVLYTASGLPCVLMEYLDGTLLSEFCNASRRPDFVKWLRWLIQLLLTLQLIHPDEDRVKHYVNKQNLSSEELTEWSRAKHGYVHRDIKPENIVVVAGRGPVLIDFNISVQAGHAVVTTSATDGYSPMVSTRWTHTCDLYALGVVALEVAAGLRVATSSIDELVEYARPRVGSDAVEFCRRLLRTPETGESTAALLAAARKLKPSPGGAPPSKN